MQIVTDRGADLSPEVAKEFNIHFTPLKVTLGERTYASGVDITPDDFYDLLESSDQMPTTSQPSVGEFAELYRTLAQTDPEILSIHISSGLSGTLNSARSAVELVPEAHVTLVDTRTLSCPQGWQVEAAARAARGGWKLDRILSFLTDFRAQTEGMFTVATLKYLIHGGQNQPHQRPAGFTVKYQADHRRGPGNRKIQPTGPGNHAQTCHILPGGFPGKAVWREYPAAHSTAACQQPGRHRMATRAHQSTL